MFAAFALGGCSREIRLEQVGGIVTRNGKPQKDVWVQFTPAKGGRSAEGLSNDSGRYTLDFSAGRHGAQAGLHRVVVMSGGRIDANGSEVTPRKVVFKGEFEVKHGDNAIDIEIP